MSAARVKPGDVLDGKYRVERVLGTGGMGMVVSAKHMQLGQRVALKFMLKEAMADRANAERFAREARAAVRLQSAHTARVSDVGKLKNGEPYMVMEYLEGQDLDEVLRSKGPMPPHVAVDYVLQACEAFAEAHSLGMIHRDIKPKNLFLSHGVDGRPIVKVLDFGLAKTVGSVGDISLTATTAVFGSPQYMSPEQMRSAKDVDTRSDIWSIGVCLYELLTGRLPFDAPGLAEICAMVLKDTVEPPSKWAVGLPPDLDAVIVKCLAKDPSERFQTVAELAFALEPWAAIEGSARRILHVMQTVQKVEVPTIVNVNVDASSQDPDQSAKTMDAWDSGERTRPHRRVHVRLWLAGCAVLAGVGLLSIAAAVHSKEKRLAAATPSASTTTMVEPSGDPAPLVTPVVTGTPGATAAAMTASTMPAAAATVAAPPTVDPKPPDPHPAAPAAPVAEEPPAPPPAPPPPPVPAATVPPAPKPTVTTAVLLPKAPPPRPPAVKPPPPPPKPPPSKPPATGKRPEDHM